MISFIEVMDQFIRTENRSEVILLNFQLKGFMHDLVILLHDKYNDTLQTNDKDATGDKDFRAGMNHAYYDTLNLIESQLKMFGYDVNEIGNITPELTKEANIK